MKTIEADIITKHSRPSTIEYWYVWYWNGDHWELYELYTDEIEANNAALYLEDREVRIIHFVLE